MQLVAAIQNLVSLASGKESAIPAHAVLTLGKISLRDDRVMTRSVGILGRELRTCSNSSVRSNIVVMLCDLVMAYPLRFDQHLIWFSIAARDPDANVRFAAISAISRLLSLDFIKMKLHIFAVLLLAAVGPINQIAALAERTLMEALGSQLNQQLPSMTLNAMFIISGEDLVGVTRSLSVELLGVLVEASHDIRCRALKLAVGHMSEEQKLSFASAVTNEIVVPVSENCLFMSRAERCLLDTIVLLAHILSTRRRRAALSNELRGELGASSKKGMHPKALEATMLSWEKVISNIVGERLVPAFAELKVVLESNKSPVQRDFMHLFLQLLDDYPEPVRRALALMPDLLSFLEYHRQRPNGRRVAHAV
jgi:condensin-2 complex subunit D3